MQTEILHLLEQYYHLKGQLKTLVGYDDRNFLLTTNEGQKFIVKLNSIIADAPFLQTQNQLFEQLQAYQSPDFQTATVSKSIDGRQIIPITLADGTPYLMRVLSFIEGQFLADVPHNVAMLRSFGHFLALLDQRLETADHTPLLHRRMVWDLLYFMDNEAFLPYLTDARERKIVHYFLLQFKYFIEKPLQKLRKRFIHNDANDFNVLTNGGKVTGIIDFGDIVYSPLINELAIALAYILMRKKEPIKVTCEILTAYHEVLPLQEEELALLYYLIVARLCTSVVQAAYSKTLQPDNTEYLNAHSVPAWNLLYQCLAINPIFAENEFRKACGFAPKPAADRPKMLQQRFQHISKALSVSYPDAPIKMKQAAFQYMYSDDGTTYLDGVNNVCHVGHAHPSVVAAAHEQMLLLNTNTRYLYDGLNEYAAQLCATFPEPLNKVFFVNSGSAASDLAVRMAFAHSKQSDMIVVEHGYHGNTFMGINISSYKFAGKGGQGAVDYIHTVPIPDLFRGKYRIEDPYACEKYAGKVEEVIDQLAEKGKGVAGFICESVIGCGGQIVPPPNYFKYVYEMLRKRGGVCIADEVQTGFGRIGTHFWAFEQQGVVPDIVILGKPMGNGHPLAAVVTTTAVAESFENGMEFFSSFGGNPVSCAVGKAVLDIIAEERLQENALEVGNYLSTAFQSLQKEFLCIGEVRGAGLFWGIELIEDAKTLAPATHLAKKITYQLKVKGIFLSVDGPFENVLKFKPPLCFSLENAQQVVSELKSILSGLSV